MSTTRQISFCHILLHYFIPFINNLYQFNEIFTQFDFIVMVIMDDD